MYAVRSELKNVSVRLQSLVTPELVIKRQKNVKFLHCGHTGVWNQCEHEAERIWEIMGVVCGYPPVWVWITSLPLCLFLSSLTVSSVTHGRPLVSNQATPLRKSALFPLHDCNKILETW